MHVDLYTEGGSSQEQALVLMIALRAYLDMVRYEKSLQKALDCGDRKLISFSVEQEYRYSVVFFLHPQEPWGMSYGEHLFSLIGKESIFWNLRRTVSSLETEIKIMEELLSR